MKRCTQYLAKQQYAKYHGSEERDHRTKMENKRRMEVYKKKVEQVKVMERMVSMGGRPWMMCPRGGMERIYFFVLCRKRMMRISIKRCWTSWCRSLSPLRKSKIARFSKMVVYNIIVGMILSFTSAV